MWYVKVVLGLPVDGPFDYSISDELAALVSPGVRVSINFRNKKETGFVVAKTRQSDVPNVKPVNALIDRYPILSAQMLALTHKVAKYYCCSWGQAIEAAIPVSLRRGRSMEQQAMPPEQIPGSAHMLKRILLHYRDPDSRWLWYFSKIQQQLGQNKQVLVIVSDKQLIEETAALIKQGLGQDVVTFYRNQPQEIQVWQQIANAKAKIVVGVRSGIFAPLPRLGLIIIDQEDAYSHKQDQMPHYHCRDVALMRADIDSADLVLGSIAPSLESFQMAKTGLLEYEVIERKAAYPNVKTVDMKDLPVVSARQKIIISKLLQDSIGSALADKSKVLLLFNRKGFATIASCNTCGKVLQCPRCNVNLVYHFHEKLLSCSYCNYTLDMPNICPQCNAGYIKYSGAGTEKVESELARIFPQARISQYAQDAVWDAADIFIATQSIVGHSCKQFGLVGVLAIDNALNHTDFRATEKTYRILTGLASLTAGRMIIQTSIPQHYIYDSVVNNDPQQFYKNELTQRKQLHFPPFRHFAFIKVRAKQEDKAKNTSYALYEKVKQVNKDGSLEVICVNPGQPAKLRGNFYWNILLSCANIGRLCDLIKKCLKDLRHSGIIVTVDIDPV